MSNPLLRVFSGLTGTRRAVESVVARRSFADVILPPATRRALDQALVHVTRHDLIFKRWGLGERHPTGLGLAFNFAGPPGTGKTICAEAIAHTLGRRLLVVRYAELESMWMGETPKNVATVFRLAREENAVLLFDEADAIASRRSASLDYGFVRETNTVVSVLLQELESFNGVVIFATNLAANLDPALERRIRMHVLFEMPGVDEREQIWRVQIHPTLTPLAGDVDFRALAERYEASGGDIRNAVLKAALAAAGEPGNDAFKAIQQRNLEDGMREVIDGKRVMQQSLFAADTTHRLLVLPPALSQYIALTALVISLLALFAALATASDAAAGAGWSRFRGPNGSGVSPVASVPTEFGPAKNLLWRLALPPGHSSPILQGDRIYLTGLREDTLLTFAIDRTTGRILWERAAPKVGTKVVDKRNNPASPSPAVDDSGAYVFFPDYGLIGYDASGAERWRLPLGPFNNIYGMGASPIVVDDLVVLACDQSVGSFVMAVNKRSGRIQWKTERPEAKSGHSTPIIWRGPDGKPQVLLPGSFLLTSYDAATGRKLWWVRGLSFEMKSTPVMAGDTIYVNGYGAPVNDPGNKVSVPAADEVWKTADADRNGVLSKPEFPKFTSAFWFDVADLDANGSITTDEWTYYRAALDSENGMLAIRLGGKGDMTDTAVRWKYQRSVPQLPSPLLYGGVLYMVNDNGIVTMLEPETGALIKQGRLAGAPGAVFASPVAAANHIFFTTEDGAVAVVAPGRDLTVTAVNDLGEDAYATPALAENRIYVRTTAALYAFGRP